MTPDWAASVDIPATTLGPGAARAVVSALLTAWGLPELVSDAEVVVSELVSNAIQHAPGTDTFELALRPHGAGAWIAIADGSAVRPVAAELDQERPAGRGIRIVQALAEDWGADDYNGGKRVWVHLGPA